MDKDTRNLILNTTQAIRRLLEEEFSLQLEGTFDIHADGRIAAEAGPQLTPPERFTRQRIVEAIQHRRAVGESAAESIRGFRAEAVFTCFNRLAALRMMEARGLVLPCVSQGDQSQGFKEFSGLAPGLVELPDKGYRLYLECLFDEIGREVGVLFDRTDAASQLWPRRKALEAVLAKLNTPELAGVWAEDETIGWIYQYFNDEAERKQMREESSAPRNSRELAVRNQFFTPRYVVEFLTDNTLGRLWYEMTKSKTSLVEKCRYLVRRPNEIFLGDGEITATPLPFDEPLASIIGDPREAHSKVFLQEDPESYESPSGWVKEAFEGNFENLPAERDPWTRWVGAAIPPPQIDAIIGERWQPMEDNTKLDRLRRSILDGTPDPEARKLPVVWAILSDFCRTNQFAGGYEWPTWQKLWSYFRHLAQSWQRFGPVKEGENLSQEELLRQPVHIPHRPLKDPREIRLLDPACGSMHFGLYAFDLFTVIYDEAWEIAHGPDDAAKSADTFEPFVTFAASFPEKAAFLREVPRLIVEHNIHGIDIDPRAAQIAGLSLWLRAQRAWHQAGVKPADRPRITRSNLVCAEPMPGEKELLREFVQQQLPAGEQPIFQHFLEAIFEKMKLAGEAGSLLRIEEEIRSAIDEAHAAWEKIQSRPLELFSTTELNRVSRAPELTGLESALTTDHRPLTTDFWQAAEQRIYDALEAYAEQAENGGGFQRRLFADDAAQGFAFIDLCRKRYDVVVMNPPFGEPSLLTDEYLEERFPHWNQNLLCAFLERGWILLGATGLTAAIFDRTAVVKSTYENFRRAVLLPDSRLCLMADLGWEVLDANVEVTTSVLSKVQGTTFSAFFDVRGDRPQEKGLTLAQAIAECVGHGGNQRFVLEAPVSFRHLPNAVIGYDFPGFLRRAFASYPSLEGAGLKAYQGHALKSDKHFRLWWELPRRPFGVSLRLFNGSGYSPYTTAMLDVVIAPCPLENLPKDTATVLRNSEHHRKPGVCFGKRGEFFCAHVLPAGHVFTVEGQAFPIADNTAALLLVGYLNTPLVRFALNKYCGQHKYSGYVNLLPWAGITDEAPAVKAVLEAAKASAHARRFDELQSAFVCFPDGRTLKEVGNKLSGAAETAVAAASDCERLFQAELTRRVDLTPEDISLVQQFARREPTPDSAIEDLGERSSAAGYAARGLVVYAVGCAFGRWDIRYATGERPAPELPDPFAPLPVCPPGMLQGDDGLPLSPEAGRRLRTEGRYPLDVAWDGILVDDPNHPADVVGRVQEVLRVLWKDRADAIEHEACELLGVKSLRDWFRKPTGFFADHFKRYSKSRRQAPIYWPLSSPNGLYTVWLYYHRLSADTLFTVLRDHVKPKLEFEERRAFQLRQEAGTTPTPSQRRDLAEAEELVEDLRAFKAELERVAPLFRPNLNDGVIINYAPLWRMIGLPKWRKDCQATWNELAKGDYDWANLALHLWPERVVPKCATDRSLAIAHGLDDVFWQEDPKAPGKWIPKKVSEGDIQKLIASRTSPAVKAALESLNGAGASDGAPRRAKKKAGA
jgi:hypothetical protein